MRKMKQSSVAFLLGVVFAIPGVVLLVLAVVLGVRGVPIAPLVLGACGPIFLIVSVVGFVFAPRIRAQERYFDGSVTPPREVMQGWGELQAAIERAFANSPYVVSPMPGGIRVIADLADARFLTLGGARRVQTVFATDVIPVQPGVVARIDSLRNVQWTAGIDGTLTARLTGSARMTQGRVVTVQARKQFGVGPKGAGPQVDYAFSSAEIATPLKAAIVDAGFRDVMPAHAKIGLVVALAAAGPAVLVGFAAAIAAALGLFD